LGNLTRLILKSQDKQRLVRPKIWL
jgi:hypothetical protein